MHVTVGLPDSVIETLDAAAAVLKCSRADVIRQALERYVEDYLAIGIALERLRDPTDPVLDWDDVKRESIAAD